MQFAPGARRFVRRVSVDLVVFDLFQRSPDVAGGHFENLGDLGRPHAAPGQLADEPADRSVNGPAEGWFPLAHHDQERVPLAQIEDVERGLRAWLTAS